MNKNLTAGICFLVEKICLLMKIMYIANNDLFIFSEDILHLLLSGIHNFVEVCFDRNRQLLSGTFG